jgi:hypothetical protein
MTLFIIIVLALSLLIPGSALAQIAELSSNATDTNTTTTEMEVIPNPPVEGEKVPIPCDENTPPGQVCRDEDDFDSCEPGFRDSGRGCEAIWNIGYGDIILTAIFFTREHVPPSPQ